MFIKRVIFSLCTNNIFRTFYNLSCSHSRSERDQGGECLVVTVVKPPVGGGKQKKDI